MGLFNKRKNKETEPIVDEKKQNEVARYRSMKHQVIKELQLKTLGKIDTYIEGKVYCNLSDTVIEVDVYGDASIEYAEKCVEAMNSMPEDLIETICRAAKRYCLDFLDAVGGAEENGIELTVQVDENTPPLEMLNCFDVGALIVDTPKDSSRIGYQLSGNCDWEEEHGIEIVILDNKLVYLGEFNGESPWSDHSGESWNAAASIDR